MRLKRAISGRFIVTSACRAGRFASRALPQSHLNSWLPYPQEATSARRVSDSERSARQSDQKDCPPFKQYMHTAHLWAIDCSQACRLWSSHGSRSVSKRVSLFVGSRLSYKQTHAHKSRRKRRAPSSPSRILHSLPKRDRLARRLRRT